MSFIGLEGPPDGHRRNWYFVWGTPRGTRNEAEDPCPPIGWMDHYDKSWQKLIGLDFACPSCEAGDRGDVNGDGETNILDVLAVVNHILLGEAREDWRGRLWIDESGGSPIPLRSHGATSYLAPTRERVKRRATSL